MATVALSDVLAAVVEDLLAQGFTDAAANCREGAEHLQQNSKPPRVVFVPGGPGKDTFAPTNRVGGNGRQLFTWKETYEVHVWGEDYADARDLRNGVMRAFVHVAGGVSKDSLQFSTGGFTPVADLQLGREYIFGVQVATPVSEPAKDTVPTGTKAAHSGTMEFPNGSIVDAC